MNDHSGTIQHSAGHDRSDAHGRSAGRWHFVATTCLAGVLLSGCGAGSDAASDGAPASTTSEPAETVAFDQWAANAQRECAQLNDRFDEVTAADPTTAEAAISYADDVAEFSAALAAGWSSFGVPSGHSAAAARAGAQLDEIADAASELRSAAESFDADAARDAGERIAELGEELNPMMVALDVPACGGF